MSNNKILALKKELEEIRKKNKGFLKPDDIVNYAKNKNTLLHKYFCWDNSQAAEKYRLQQAECIIRSVKIEIIPNSKKDEIITIREYVSLPNDRGVNGYRQIDEVLNETKLKLQLIESIQKEFDSFRIKLKTISEVAFKKSDSIKKELQKEKEKFLRKTK